MCWFCDGVKKLVNTSIVIYDDTTANYSHGVELADDSERINKLFEDMLGEEENDQ